MLYGYLNINLGTKLLFEQKLYRVFATFSICYQHGQTFSFKILIECCLDKVIADVLTCIAYCIRPHIQIYDPRHDKTLLHIQKHMRGDCTADESLCLLHRQSNSSTSRIRDFKPLRTARTWSETPKTGLLITWHILLIFSLRFGEPRPSSAVRPVRPWPYHFFWPKMVLAGPLFLPIIYFFFFFFFLPGNFSADQILSNNIDN